METSFSFINEHLGELSTRALQLQDLPEILAIEKSTHLTPWSETNFKSSIESSHLVIGLFNNTAQLLGYAVLAAIAGEAEVLLFVIDEKHHGNKVGKNFLQALLLQLQNTVGAVFLEVRAGNMPAISLYETVGFNQVGERPRYYSTPWGKEDALIYAYEFVADFQ